MSAQSVPTFRAAHLLPYLEFLHSKGVCFDRVLQKFRLPIALSDHPETRLPLVPAVRFLSHIERSEGLRDLGMRASDQVTIKLLSQTTLRSILAAPNLGAALEIFTRRAGFESSVVEAWMVADGSEIKLCKIHRVSLDNEELRLMTLHFMLLFVAVVRVFAGPDWSPKVIALRSRGPFSTIAGDRFPNTQFLFNQAMSWIDLPRDMLSLRKGQNGGIRPNALATIERGEPLVAFADDFATSLKRVLKAYLPDGYPSIDLAAAIAGTSVRTLQRNLAQSGLTYSKLIENTRFEAAMEMLEEPGAKIIDIAYAVGYEDPSHFSRAFRRMAGTSPRGFRMSGAA